MIDNEPDLFHLDKNRLDDEWIKQPRYYHEYSDKLADAKRDLEKAKAEHDLTVAELDKEIRTTPSEFGLEKVTETALRSTMILQTSYRDSERAIINARHKVDLIQSIVSSLDHRKYALQDLVKLRLADYFSEPKAGEGAREQMGKVVRDTAFGSKTKSKKNE